MLHRDQSVICFFRKLEHFPRLPVASDLLPN
jgi:hypothetical protein